MMERGEEDFRRYRKGRDEASFRSLVTTYSPMVLATARRILGDDKKGARDVCQQVFVKLAKKAAELDPGICLGGWLYRQACRAALDQRRANPRRKARKEKAAFFMTMNDPDQQVVLGELKEASGALTDQERDPLVLRYLEGRSHDSVGKQLGITAGGIYPLPPLPFKSGDSPQESSVVSSERSSRADRPAWHFDDPLTVKALLAEVRRLYLEPRNSLMKLRLEALFAALPKEDRQAYFRESAHWLTAVERSFSNNRFPEIWIEENPVEAFNFILAEEMISRDFMKELGKVDRFLRNWLGKDPDVMTLRSSGLS